MRTKERFKQFLYDNNAYDKFTETLKQQAGLNITKELDKYIDNDMESIIFHAIYWGQDHQYWKKVDEQWRAHCRVSKKRAERVMDDIDKLYCS